MSKVDLGVVAITILAAVWAMMAVWLVPPAVAELDIDAAVMHGVFIAGYALVGGLLFRHRVGLAQRLFGAAGDEAGGAADGDVAPVGPAAIDAGAHLGAKTGAKTGPNIDASSEQEGLAPSPPRELQAAALSVVGVLILYWTLRDVTYCVWETVGMSVERPLGDVYPGSLRAAHAVQMAVGLWLFCRSRKIVQLWSRAQERPAPSPAGDV